MKFLPSDPDKRWNRILAITAVAFSIWLLVIVASSIWGVNQEVQDDALLIGSAAGFMTVLLGQYRHGKSIERTADKIDQVYEHVNNVEEQEAIPGDDEPEKPTLGSLLRKIEHKVDEGFTANDQALEAIRSDIDELKGEA
jgi:hypothetical protein